LIYNPVYVDAGGRAGPDSAVDEWCAPELAAVVLRVTTQRGRETTEWKNIRRGEPAAALFEIPADHTILEKAAWPRSAPQETAPDR